MVLGAVNRISFGVLLGCVALGAAIVALPPGDYRLAGASRAPPSKVSADPAVAPALSGSAAVAQPSSSVAEAPGAGAPGAGIDAELDLDETSDAGATLPDGRQVPELQKAPKHLTFGVVLISYAGAQGAPRNARSKAAAEKLAGELFELSKTDFPAAVKKGDPGSSEDVGKMYRSILEPAPEYVLFSLDPGQVGGPVDTPRGYWIVRRIK